MGFRRVTDLGRALAETGAADTAWMHKTGSPALTAAGMWGDLSMAPGTPRYNAYVGVQGEFTPMAGQGNFGIYMGPAVAPATKHITRIGIQTPGATMAPATFLLCDYLGFYPLVDMDSTDPQSLDNPAPLPRYASGVGVRAMLVTTTPQTSVAQVDVTYTNTQGVSGRASTVWAAPSNTGMLVGAQANTGGANAQAPFLPLASGDTGMLRVDGVQLAASAGGFCALVLVKVVESIVLREQNTFAEIDVLPLRPPLEQVMDGAHLNYIFTSGVAATSSVVRGFVDYAWN